MAVAGFHMHQLTSVIIVLALVCGCSAQSYDDSNIEDEIGLNTSQVLRLRGYQARDYTVLTEDGYALNLVEGWNPMIDYDCPEVAQKEPVLFLHGALYNATCYITDTPKPASPKDYSRYNASQNSQEQIEALYQDSPNIESLVLMLLDFGHKVYLLNRRNTLASQQAYVMQNNISFVGDPFNNGSAAAAKAVLDSLGVGLPAPLNQTSVLGPLSSYLESLASAFDPAYWDFSLDEQAKYDLPAVVRFILKLLKRRTLAAVGWSAGGAIIEMGLATQPELNEKISKSLLWSPALYLSRTYRDSLLYAAFAPIINAYIGPINPQFVNDILDELLIRLCSTEATQQTICQAVFDVIGGYGDGQQLVKPGFFNSFPATTSTHEFAQLGQNSISNLPRFYDFGSAKNQAKYGSIEPPIYNVSKITSKGLYFWGAQYDILVSIDDVARNVKDLSVPAVFTRLDQPGTFFEHLSYIWHRYKGQLLYIRSLRIIES